MSTITAPITRASINITLRDAIREETEMHKRHEQERRAMARKHDKMLKDLATQEMKLATSKHRAARITPCVVVDAIGRTITPQDDVAKTIAARTNKRDGDARLDGVFAHELINAIGDGLNLALGDVFVVQIGSRKTEMVFTVDDCAGKMTWTTQSRAAQAPAERIAA